MTESMVERVARAIYASHPAEFEPDQFEAQCPQTQEACRAQARAAIAAMREPTDDVLIGCLEGGVAYSKGPTERIKAIAEGNEAIAIMVACGDGRLYKAAWVAGIDAALSEEKETA